jgi:catechol 2,3-dioxygenase-like lactoylglutathione lyase family enzyme
MLHHASLGVSDVSKAAAFYDAILGALGYKRTAQYLPYAIGYGEGVSEFWIQLPHDNRAATSGNGAHVAFAARSREAVHRFHEAALSAGGADDGAPGPRADYGPDYYGAFVRDPFGNKIEAVLRPAAGKTRARRQPRAPSRVKSLRKSALGKSKTGRSRAATKPRRRKV